MLNHPITEDWLKEVGFKWHQLDRQPDKQWLLWLGDACAAGDTQDLGIELAPNRDKDWFCWLRSDTAHRYSRFIHVRHMKVRGDVIRLVVALTDLSWDPSNHIYGSVMRPERAAALRESWERLDAKWLRQGHPWRDIEKDDSRGGALPEHMQHAINAKLAK